MEGLKDFLISLVKVIIPCAIIALVAFIIVKLQPEPVPEPDIEVRGFDDEASEIYLENDDLKFTMDTGTTFFTVEDKRNGKKWYSNPVDADADQKALPADKNLLKSTMILTYGNINGIWTQYNNYALSIENGLYEIEQSADSIKVKYTIGNVKKEYILPVAVPESRMNELLDLMEKKQQKQVKEYYRKYDIKKLRKTDNKEELLAKYPTLEEEPVYVLIDTAADYLKKKIEDIFASVGYTYEDYEADLARYENKTEQDMPIFNVSMVYRLNGDQLVVEVPYDELEYKSDYPIVTLKVLPFMGAGGTNAEGFIIVPESGGGYIAFNNGKQDQNAYASQLYGWDYASSRKAVVSEPRNAFPAFGICNDGASFVCVSDVGSSFASVNADVSGRVNSYNYANFSYSVLHYESYEVSSKSSSNFYVYEAEVPHVTVSQRYCFSDATDYIGMAGVYRDYLLEKYPAMAGGTDASLPVVIDVLQAVDKVQQKFGVPVSAAYPLTTYDETLELADKLAAAGLTDYKMRISGWMNGGIKHDVLNKIKTISGLGGKKDFNSMLSGLKAKGLDVYLDGQIEFAYDNKAFDGFVVFSDTAKMVSREEVKLYTYSIIWYGQEDYNDPYYLLKPQHQQEYFNTLKDYAKSSGVGISARNIGYLLNSDFNPKNLYTREKMIELQQELLKNAAADGEGILINYGNEYAIEYADVITSMDITNSNNAIIDYDIPFYEAALHGIKSYTGAPINLAEDYTLELLKSAEYGAGLSFMFMFEDAGALQDTMYTKYFGADYERWSGKFAEIYAKYKASFDGLNSLKIIGHSRAGDHCRITEYEDGTKVYVNYGYEDETVDGVAVPARDYIVERR